MPLIPSASLSSDGEAATIVSPEMLITRRHCEIELLLFCLGLAEPVEILSRELRPCRGQIRPDIIPFTPHAIDLHVQRQEELPEILQLRAKTIALRAQPGNGGVLGLQPPLDRIELLLQRGILVLKRAVVALKRGMFTQRILVPRQKRRGVGEEAFDFLTLFPRLAAERFRFCRHSGQVRD